GFGVAVDSADQTYLVGSTSSGDLPTAHAVQWQPAGGLDVFLTVFNAAGTGLQSSTYLGGGFDDWGGAVALGPDSTAFLTGATTSHDFPLVRPLIPGAAPGAALFVAAIGTTCPLAFSDVPTGSTFAAYITCLAC